MNDAGFMKPLAFSLVLQQLMKRMPAPYPSNCQSEWDPSNIAYALEYGYKYEYTVCIRLCVYMAVRHHDLLSIVQYLASIRVPEVMVTTYFLRHQI